jgi:hypothetical protein
VAQLALWERTGDPKHAIPGYSFPPQRDPRTSLPHGWSYENILRQCRPSNYARAATKQGPKHASEFLPPVLTTRVGSGVLSRILFDDQELDTMLADGVIALSGIKDAFRPVSFNALDFYTAAHLKQHLRALVREPDDKKRRALTGREFTWFVIAVLQTIGYRADAIGTECIFEWGTANSFSSRELQTLSGWNSFEEAVSAVLDGHVRVNRSGKFNQPLFADMYFRPQSTGNFRFKTWIESAFRLLRTWMQALPGPTGSNARENKPEELQGILVRERQLLTAVCDRLDAHSASLLRHHLLSFQQFHQLICAVYQAINRRTEHELEGWSQCGFTFPLWRPALPDAGQPETWFSWAELERLDDISRQLMLARINGNRDGLTRESRLSPADALALTLEQDKPNIRRLPDHLVGLLLPVEWSISGKKVGSDGTITLPNPLWQDTADTYICGGTDQQGRRWSIEPGRQLRVWHNPFGDGRAHLHHPDGGYIGTVHPIVRAKPFDQEAYLAQLGVRASIKSGHDAELRARLADVASERQRREKHNDQVLRGEPCTPEEKALQRRCKRAARREAADEIDAASAATDVFRAAAFSETDG